MAMSDMVNVVIYTSDAYDEACEFEVRGHMGSPTAHHIKTFGISECQERSRLFATW
jgi:Uri superfamily endonuclease